MVVQRQLVGPAVCLSDLQACEELIHSFIRQRPNNIMLSQEAIFTISEQKKFNLWYLQTNYFEIHA